MCIPDLARRIRERGWALISVLWVLSILAMLVAASQSLSFNSALQEQRARAAGEEGAALDAGIVRAVIGIGDTRPQARWRVDGVAQDFELDGLTIRVTIQDEAGRIDLNAADGSLIAQLLRASGLDKGHADALTANIVDWRNAEDDFERRHGARAAKYAGAGRSYRPRHGAFQSVDELQLVLGMTPEIFERIRPALTVYSRHPAIETDTAPPLALRAYYPDQVARIADILRGRSNAANGTPPGTLAAGSALSGRAFDILVELPNTPHARTREAVVMLTNDPGRPYLVLAWR